MTKEDIKKLSYSTPNQSWKNYFSDDEWFRIVEGLYNEYSKYSSIDMGFGMYYQAGLMKLLSSDGPGVLREKFL